MRSDETHKHILWRKLYYNNKPVIIMLNVEYIMLLSNIIYAIERLFDVFKASPLRRFGLFYPFQKCRLCLWMLLIILFYSCLRYNSHYALS